MLAAVELKYLAWSLPPGREHDRAMWQRWAVLHPEGKARHIALRQEREREAACQDHEACRVTEAVRTMALLIRDGECWMCGVTLRHVFDWAPDRAELDHIDPISRDGKHCIDNVAWACSSCNKWKNDSLIEELFA